MEAFEKVEKIREKTGVSYEEAKLALETNNYDLLDAIVCLERQGKVKAPEVETYTTTPQENSSEMVRAQAAYEQSCRKKSFGDHMDDFFRWVGKWIKKGCERNFVVERHGERVMRMPILVFILLILFAFWVMVPLIVIGMFCDFHYRMEGEEKVVQDINHACGKVSEVCASVKEDIKK